MGVANAYDKYGKKEKQTFKVFDAVNTSTFNDDCWLLLCEHVYENGKQTMAVNDSCK